MNKFYIIIMLWSILSCGGTKSTTTIASTTPSKTTSTPPSTPAIPTPPPSKSEPTAPEPIIDVAPSVHTTVMNTESASGQMLYETKCNTCHTFKKPTSKTVEQWQKIVPNMVNMANKTKILITEEEKKLILEYVVALNRK
jgi:cytochrome c5